MARSAPASTIRRSPAPNSPRGSVSWAPMTRMGSLGREAAGTGAHAAAILTGTDGEAAWPAHTLDEDSRTTRIARNITDMQLTPVCLSDQGDEAFTSTRALSSALSWRA